jgi:hypothetical protein
MPRTLDRQEATRRLAIRATHDDGRNLTHGKFAGLFHASYTTIREALGRTVREWRAVVSAARPVPSALPVARQLGRHSMTSPGPQPWRPGSRDQARLVPPDPADDFKDPEPPADLDTDPPDDFDTDPPDRFETDPTEPE